MGMRFLTPRKKMTLATCILLAVSVALKCGADHIEKSKPRFPHQWMQQPVPGMTEVPNGTLEHLAEFKTHLPIVVLEFTDGEPKPHKKWDPVLEYLTPVEENPFAGGFLRLYYNQDIPNRLSDDPIVETRISSRLRGASSLEFPKAQYLIKTLKENGRENHIDILGMGADWEWILNISYIDKSLLRNYMCLALAEEIMGYAPETRYCEVFRKRDDQYEYLGVYLIMESIKRGKDRLRLTKYDPHQTRSSFLVVRDRFYPEDLMLDTYGTIYGFTKTILSLRYPNKRKVTPRTLKYIETEISRFEEALYSYDPAVFVTYREMADLDTFVDYFIINEFFTNYDSVQHSFYTYKNIEGKLRLGPVWDFDMGIANTGTFEFNPESLSMRYGQWLSQLSKDGKFVQMLKHRYAELRGEAIAAGDNELSKAAGLLSDEAIERFIDGTVGYLGDARIRDWNRWRYNDHSVLHPGEKYRQPALLNNTRNFEEEIELIKTVLSQHGAAIPKGLDEMYETRIVD